MDKSRLQNAFFAILLSFWFASTGWAVPVFYVNSGTSPSNDLTWIAAVGPTAEEDFNSFADGLLAPFTLADITITASQPNIPATPYAVFSTFNPTGTSETFSDTRVLSCSTPTCQAGEFDHQVEFSFSRPVIGFGLWIFDDGTSATNSFTMTANGQTSGVLDAIPGSMAHTVEGFLGVHDIAGISSLTVSGEITKGVWQFDHVQVATLPVPLPASLLLLITGLLSMLRIAGRRK